MGSHKSIRLVVLLVLVLGVILLSGCGKSSGTAETATNGTDSSQASDNSGAQGDALPGGGDEQGSMPDGDGQRGSGGTMTDAQKSEMEAKLKEREEAEKKVYDALSSDLKAIVDEIRAAYNVNTKDMTDEQKAELKTKQEAVTKKINSLSEADQKAIADFMPRTGRGNGGGNAPNGTPPNGTAPVGGTNSDTTTAAA